MQVRVLVLALVLGMVMVMVTMEDTIEANYEGTEQEMVVLKEAEAKVMATAARGSQLPNPSPSVTSVSFKERILRACTAAWPS